MLLLLRKLLGPGSLLAISSCTVYVPMQPHLPAVQARGEGELMAQVQPTIRPELMAAYSPLNHVVLLAGGSWRPMGLLGEKDNTSVAQYELGLGAYHKLGAHWTGQGAVGLGQAHNKRNVGNGPFAFNSNYETTYTTHFGQLGLTHQTSSEVWGIGYRLTQVTFQYLTASDSGTGTFTRYVLPLDGQLRHEPFLFRRTQLSGPQGRWWGEASAAFSFCSPGRPSYPNTLNEEQFRAQYNRGSVWLLSVGLTYHLTRIQ